MQSYMPGAQGRIRVKDVYGVFRDIPVEATTLEMEYGYGDGYSLKGLKFPEGTVQTLTIVNDGTITHYKVDYTTGILAPIDVANSKPVEPPILMPEGSKLFGLPVVAYDAAKAETTLKITDEMVNQVESSLLDAAIAKSANITTPKFATISDPKVFTLEEIQKLKAFIEVAESATIKTRLQPERVLPSIIVIEKLKIVIIRYYEGNQFYEAILRKGYLDNPDMDVMDWLVKQLGIKREKIPKVFVQHVAYGLQNSTILPQRKYKRESGQVLQRSAAFQRLVKHPLSDKLRNHTSQGADGVVRMPLGNLIVELNDTHRWSRERIADWLDTLDEQPTFYPRQPDPNKGLVNTAKVVTLELPSPREESNPR